MPASDRRAPPGRTAKNGRGLAGKDSAATDSITAAKLRKKLAAGGVEGKSKPAWWVHSDEEAWNFNHVTFRILREQCLRLSQYELADYLRVSQKTVCSWERGRFPIPFAAWEAVRLQIENVAFAFSHPKWKGWKVDQRYGYLVSPHYSLLLTPVDIELLTITHQRLGQADKRAREMEAEIAKLTAENIRLREPFLSAGLTDELHSIKARLADLLGQVGTAHVLPLPVDASTEREAA